MLPSCKAQAWVQGALPPRGRHTHRGCSAIDYRGQAEQGAVSIIDCWVHQAIGNERHVTTQLGIILKVVLQHMDSTWTRGTGKEGQSRAEQSGEHELRQLLVLLYWWLGSVVVAKPLR